MREEIVQVRIESINKDGKGLGPFTDSAGNQKLAEVSFCMPGDVCEVSVKRKKKGVYPARFLTLIEGSPDRIKPKCLHFGSCGGCRFQEIPYESQLLFKQKSVANLFAGIMDPQAIIPSEKQWQYRNKMEFSFSQDKAKTHYLGLFLEGARGKVLNVQECHLVSPWFAEVLTKVRAWWQSTDLLAYHPPSNRGTLRTLTLREAATSGERLVMLTISGHPEYAMHKPELTSFQNLFDDEVGVFLRIHQAIKGEPTQFFEMHLKGKEWISETLEIALGQTRSKVEFQVSPSAFFQPNTLSAMTLYQTALGLAGLSKEAILYDLYCGTGTLGLLAAPFVQKVIGIELSAESSLDARENAKRQGIENIEVFTGSVGDVLRDHKDLPPPTVVLLDPPRTGLDPVSLKEVLSLACKKIVYISCNPETQVRDVRAFMENGYLVQAVQPVDQFPSTPHIENIVLLNKE